MSSDVVAAYHKEHSIALLGKKKSSFKPVLAFEDANLDKRAMKICNEFKAPTPIQAMCWPVIASGRDIIGIAETGSGKTLAFSVPALAHMLHRKENPIKGKIQLSLFLSFFLSLFLSLSLSSLSLFLSFFLYLSFFLSFLLSFFPSFLLSFSILSLSHAHTISLYLSLFVSFSSLSEKFDDIQFCFLIFQVFRVLR